MNSITETARRPLDRKKGNVDLKKRVKIWVRIGCGFGVKNPHLAVFVIP